MFRAAVPALGFLLVLAHVVSSPVVAQQAGKAADAPAAGPTFTKDVAPILQKNCQNCHQSGAIGPMSLATYEEVRPWARAIKQRVLAGEMPPYRYDRHVGIQQLKYDLRLSEAEMRTIALWVDNGTPRGNPADMPPPVTFPDPSKWAFADELGPPDLIIPTKPYTVAAKGQDVWWRPIVPTGLTKDRCIKAIIGQAVAQRSRLGAPRQQRAGGAGPEDRTVRGRRAAHGVRARQGR